MKVLLVSYGSRGDIQPFLALALALGNSGHNATLAAPAGYRDVARRYGIDFEPLYDGLTGVLSDVRVREGLESNFGGIRGKLLAVHLMATFRPVMARMLDDLAALLESSYEVVIHLPSLPGRVIGKALGIPSLAACLQPMWVPTPDMTNPRLSLQLPRWLNSASYRASDWWIRGVIGGVTQWMTDRMGLPQGSMRDPACNSVPVLHAFSKYLMPTHVKFSRWVETTGHWSLPAPPGWSPQQAIVDFLNDGAPPVYIGLGSFVGKNPDEIGRIVLRAVEAAGVRAVVVRGLGGIDVDGHNERVLYVNEAPFDWLFPRMAAIVHHGGSGTVGAALAAGKPQIVCPFVYEQPFFASRLHSLGVAAKPLSSVNLKAEHLAYAIQRSVADRTLARNAEGMKYKVENEPGVRKAVNIVENIQ